MFTHHRAAVTALTVALVGTSVFAHTGATGVVKERMEAMESMGDAVKSVGDMFRGEAIYDADIVRAAARTIQDHSGSAMTDLFPEGTNEAPSEAKDAIWLEWNTFSEMAQQLDVMAQGLARAAENNAAGAPMPSENMMGGSGGMMGGSGSMMGGSTPMTVDHLAEMPVDAVFTMMSQTCSACHTRFRAEEE